MKKRGRPALTPGYSKVHIILPDEMLKRLHAMAQEQRRSLSATLEVVLRETVLAP